MVFEARGRARALRDGESASKSHALSSAQEPLRARAAAMPSPAVASWGGRSAGSRGAGSPGSFGSRGSEVLDAVSREAKKQLARLKYMCNDNPEEQQYTVRPGRTPAQPRLGQRPAPLARAAVVPMCPRWPPVASESGSAEQLLVVPRCPLPRRRRPLSPAFRSVQVGFASDSAARGQRRGSDASEERVRALPRPPVV